MVAPMEKETRQLLVFAPNDARQICILVPKRRGEGFVKVPFGHHDSPLSEVAAAIGYDFYGLDGSLNVQTGWLSASLRDHMIETVVPPIAEYYGMGWRLVDKAEFFEKHPIRH